MRTTTVRQQQQYQRRRVAVIVLIIFFMAANNVKVKCERVVEEEKEDGAVKLVGPKRQQQQQQQLELPQSRQQPQQLEQLQELQQLERYNFLVGIASVGVRHENATKCGKELEVMLKAIAKKEFWTLKVLDSFGVTPKSFQWGNYFWFSAQQLCDDLNTPYSITFSKRQGSVYNSFNVTSPVPLRFTIVYLQFSTPHYIDLKLPFENLIHLGLCLPDSCSSSVLQQHTKSYFRKEGFDTQRKFEMKLQVVDVRTPSFKWSFFKQTGSILFTIILFLVILFTVVAEIIHKTKIKLRSQQHTKTAATSTSPAMQQPVTEMQQSQKKSSTFEMILLCFRIGENYRRAIKLENASTGNFLGVIAGIRTVICLWVTVFHVYYYSLYAMSNAPLIFAKLEYFALQPVMQACFYVDVFFIISAFLLVYNFLSNQLQRKQIQHNNIIENAKLFFKTILYRYLRLTPVLIITMLLSDMVSDFLNMYSPFHLGVHSGIYCKNNWWYNLFYIQNLLDMKNICCSWTWYLGCEMQYFILFTALLFLYAKNAKVAKIVFIILALGFVVTGWMCNYRNGITFQIDVIHSTLNQLYIKPWVRINPYVGGAAFGWLLHRYHQHQHAHHNHRQSPQQQQQMQQQQGSSYQHHHQQEKEFRGVQLHAVWRAAFWLFCAIVYVTTNFMSYWRATPSWLVATIMSFGKLLFALCIGGVIVLCARGYGGIFNTLLNARIFSFLNKFCFSIYMVAPVIVVAVFGLRNEATNFTEVGSGMDFFAVVLLSIISAFLLMLLVEMPVQRISNEFLRNSQKNENGNVNVNVNGYGNGNGHARSVA